MSAITEDRAIICAKAETRKTILQLNPSDRRVLNVYEANMLPIPEDAAMQLITASHSDRGKLSWVNLLAAPQHPEDTKDSINQKAWKALMLEQRLISRRRIIFTSMADARMGKPPQRSVSHPSNAFPER